MKRALVTLVKVVAGAGLGYAVYIAVLIAVVALKAARVHYFDKEALLYGVIAPIGALDSYVEGNWRGYPGWVHLRNVLAYILVVAGGALAVLRRRGFRQ